MARSAKLAGTINWSDGSPFNGWAVFLLVPPDGYSRMFLADVFPKVQIPLRIAVPVVNGVFNQNCRVWYNADLEPVNSKWVIYWLDFTGTTIASPATMSDAFSISTATHTVTPPTLTAPTTESVLPPIDWDPNPVALQNFFTSDTNGNNYALTNLGRLKTNGAISFSGTSSGVNLGPLAFLDYFPGGTTRLVARGPDNSTNGSVQIITTRANGDEIRSIVNISQDGSVSLNIDIGASLSIGGLAQYANNAAAASGGVPVGGLYIASSGDPRQLCIRV